MGNITIPLLLIVAVIFAVWIIDLFVKGFVVGLSVAFDRHVRKIVSDELDLQVGPAVHAQRPVDTAGETVEGRLWRLHADLTHAIDVGGVAALAPTRTHVEAALEALAAARPQIEPVTAPAPPSQPS